MNLPQFLAIATAAVLSTSPCRADDTTSLIPILGSKGRDITVKAKDGNTVKGWLPADWQDNTEWAAVSATYTKLPDPPKEGVTAVRIKVEKVDEGQLQLTTWTKPKFKAGIKYVIEGWVRSAENAGIHVGIRQVDDPYEFYAEESLEAGPKWKEFSFEFTLTGEKEAFVMFYKNDTGTLDLAGVVVRVKK